MGTVVWTVSANVRLTERKVSLVKIEDTILVRLYDVIRKESIRRTVLDYANMSGIRAGNERGVNTGSAVFKRSSGCLKS